MIVSDPDPDANPTRGTIVDSFTESVDTMPTVLEWLGLAIPRQCDGRSLLSFCRGQAPRDWRTEVHYEFDFRDVYYSQPESSLGLPMDRCSLAVVRDASYKYVHFAALPALIFDLREDPNEFIDRSGDPDYAARVRDYAQKMLSWRLAHADKALTGYRATPGGLECRA
jgi:arylsulfatase A-like enzyme